MKVQKILVVILALVVVSLSACTKHEGHGGHEESGKNQIVVTSPIAKDVILTEQYVCQIHSRCHIKIRALVGGYLEKIYIKEGQEVKQGDMLFKILPTLYQANLDAKQAEVRRAQVELEQSRNLRNDKVVSPVDVALHEAKLANAKAEAMRADAELKFTGIKAPFAGIVDRLYEQEGSLIKEQDMLTTLSDNHLLWVYFNVPESRYLEFMAQSVQEKEKQRIELQLANGSIFPYSTTAASLTVEAQFNNENGNVPFRADIQNMNGLLRHGMTGNILIHKKLKNAIVIPQRATFEILENRYVFVVDKDNVVHQRLITVQHELPDIFVIKKGLAVEDRIIFEGVRQVHDGEKVEFEFRPPAKVLENQKFHAE